MRFNCFGILVIIPMVALAWPPPVATTAATVDNDIDRNSKLSPMRDNDATATATSKTTTTTDQRFGDCDYFEYLVPNKSYDIYSPGFANATVYDANTNCRWTAVAPAEHSIRLDCGDVYMPKVCACVCE